MKILVTGGREYADKRFLFAVLDRIHAQFKIDLLIHGAARGADALAGVWAQANGVAQLPCPAPWDGYAQTYAGRIRNGRMLREHRPDLVVGFTGGTGTAHMLQLAREWGFATLDLRGKTLE